MSELSELAQANLETLKGVEYPGRIIVMGPAVGGTYQQLYINGYTMGRQIHMRHDGDKLYSEEVDPEVGTVLATQQHMESFRVGRNWHHLVLSTGSFATLLEKLRPDVDLGKHYHDLVPKVEKGVSTRRIAGLLGTLFDAGGREKFTLFDLSAPDVKEDPFDRFEHTGIRYTGNIKHLEPGVGVGTSEFTHDMNLPVMNKNGRFLPLGGSIGETIDMYRDALAGKLVNDGAVKQIITTGQTAGSVAIRLFSEQGIAA